MDPSSKEPNGGDPLPYLEPIPQMKNRKFMMAMSNEEIRVVRKAAKKRHITIQQVIRAVMVPEWLEVERKKTRR